jgi:hypothetical protein
MQAGEAIGDPGFDLRKPRLDHVAVFVEALRDDALAIHEQLGETLRLSMVRLGKLNRYCANDFIRREWFVH